MRAPLRTDGDGRDQESVARLEPKVHHQSIEVAEELDSIGPGQAREISASDILGREGAFAVRSAATRFA